MARTPDFFAANAASYDRSRPSLLSDVARDAIVRAARLPLQGSILDAAAGTGRVAIPLARAGQRLVAVDRSEEMLNVLRGKAATARVTAVAASGASLPFGNGTFDAVLIAGLLYLTPEWQHILVEGLRVLAGGGHLLHEWANGTPSEPSIQSGPPSGSTWAHRHSARRRRGKCSRRLRNEPRRGLIYPYRTTGPPFWRTVISSDD